MIGLFNRFFINLKRTIRFFGYYFLIVVLLMLFLNLILFNIRNTQNDVITNNLKTTAQHELNNINLYIETKLAAIHEDVHLVLNANELSDYLADSSPANLFEYQAMLYRVMTSKAYLMNTYMIDINGDITYRIKRKLDGSLETSTDDLGSIQSESFFTMLSMLDEDKLFISELHLHNNAPVITLIKPIYKDNHIDSYLYFDADTQTLLGILKQYAEETEYLSFGLVNDHSIWSYDSTLERLRISTDSDRIISLQQAIEERNSAIALTFDFYKSSDHFVPEEVSDINIYVQINRDLAIADSSYILLRYQWLILVYNLIAMVALGYITTTIRKRSEDRLVINANMYLTKDNQDTVIITDYHQGIEYTNDMFLKIYGYENTDIRQKTINEIIGVDHVHPFAGKQPKPGFESFVWTKTDVGIYLLNHLRINVDNAFREKQKHYIYVYSEPKIELDRYHIYLARKESTLIVFRDFLVNQPVIKHETTIMLLRIDSVNILNFVKFLNLHLNDDCMIAIINRNYVMFFGQIQKNKLPQKIEQIELLIERYRYLPLSNRYISYLFVIAQASDKVNSLDDLLDGVLIGLEYARFQPQYKHIIYQSNMRQHIERGNAIFNQLEHGFINHEFYMNYQPQKHASKDRFFGCEALLRWHNEALGDVSPFEFISVIENSFYVSKLSIYVVEKVIEDFTPYAKKLPKDFKISINLTSFDFNDKNMMERLMNLIIESPIDQHHFIFEITESQYIDNIKKTNRIVERIHDNQMLVAIDDFGTGYSSISSLKSIDVDLVKIDRAFVKDIPDTDDGQMLKTMIDLVHGLNKTVIVEGTETATQVDFCISHHCEYIQGYFISKPVDIQTIINKFLVSKSK